MDSKKRKRVNVSAYYRHTHSHSHTHKHTHRVVVDVVFASFLFFTVPVLLVVRHRDSLVCWRKDVVVLLVLLVLQSLMPLVKYHPLILGLEVLVFVVILDSVVVRTVAMVAVVAVRTNPMD